MTRATMTIRAAWLGRVPYLDGWRLQEAVASRVRAGDDARLLLLEHDPVYTVGRRGTVGHLLVDLAELRRGGASLDRVDRGGDQPPPRPREPGGGSAVTARDPSR